MGVFHVQVSRFWTNFLTSRRFLDRPKFMVGSNCFHPLPRCDCSFVCRIP